MSEEQGKILPVNTNPTVMASDIALLKERVAKLEKQFDQVIAVFDADQKIAMANGIESIALDRFAKLERRTDNLEARAEHSWSTAITWNDDAVRSLDALEKRLGELEKTLAESDKPRVPEYPLTFQDAAQLAFFGKTVERSDGERMSAHGNKHCSYLWADSRKKAHVIDSADFQLGWREVTQ